MERTYGDVLRVFDLVTDAVAAVADGAVVYANGVARVLFGDDVVDKEASEYFEELMLDASNGDMIGSVRVGERIYEAAAANMDGMRVITVNMKGGLAADAAAASVVAETVCARLNNQLAVCNTGLGLLNAKAKDDGDVGSLRYVAIVDKACYNMACLVDHSMYLYTGLGTAPLTVSNLNMVELVSGLVTTVDYLLSARGVELTYSASHERIQYYGDGRLLERMLLTVLSNSYKYTPANGKIVIDVKNIGKGVMISVRDNGSGMPAKLFASLISHGSAPLDTGNPLGGGRLGLPMVRRIAERHGGSVFIESKPDIGTTVTIYLPFRNPPETFKETPIDYRNSIEIFLRELSDVLDYKAYIEKDI